MFASAFIKRKLGVISVSSDNNYISIEGISRLALEVDIQNHWGTSVIGKQMFQTTNYSTVKFGHFFAPDVLYILNTLYKEGRTRTPKRLLDKVIQLLLERTWLGTVDKVDINKIDVSAMMTYSVLKPKSYQVEFVKHYIAATKVYNLKGYMLDSAPGTGKTLSLLFLSHVLNATGRKVFIVPKNSVERVWEATITDLLHDDGKCWTSLQNKPLDLSYKFYVVHYEQLELILDFVKKNQRAFSDTFVGLDESHNFNRIAADRTSLYLQLTSLPCITNNVWSSGTPISALGSECIPFLKCIDPYFNHRGIEDAFRKLYGSNAKRANDVLRHRIGHLKFYVPSQDAVTIETTLIDYKIQIPNPERFTMDEIGKGIRAFMEERAKYYLEHRHKYERDYAEALLVFKQTSAYKRDTAAFDKYTRYIKIISGGYDPKAHKVEAMYCNVYELKTIIPTLPSKMAQAFKSARSVVKYVHLKVLGEGLGLLSRYRSACFAEMVPHSKLPELIDEAKKKTIIFTSYVDVVEKTGEYLTKEGYNPVLIYGETNKNLSPLVKKFFDDPDANPLIATFQSLSTAVPLIAANRIININQPFRAAIKTQSIARAARLGQDMNVDVFDILLDTGVNENISTRNQDILQWSAEMVSSIMGTSNLDLDTLSLESDDIYSPETLVSDNPAEIPPMLYHGSMFKQTELKPGFKHTGKVVRWDKTESNEWLYVTSDPDEAKLLGIASALEKVYKTKGYHYVEGKRELTITTGGVKVSLDDLRKLPVYLYRLYGDVSDGWQLNYNLTNGITTEYKTQSTITDNIIECRQVVVADLLADWTVIFKH